MHQRENCTDRCAIGNRLNDHRTPTRQDSMFPPRHSIRAPRASVRSPPCPVAGRGKAPAPTQNSAAKPAVPRPVPVSRQLRVPLQCESAAAPCQRPVSQCRPRKIRCSRPDFRCRSAIHSRSSIFPSASCNPNLVLRKYPLPPKKNSCFQSMRLPVGIRPVSCPPGSRHPASVMPF